MNVLSYLLVVLAAGFVSNNSKLVFGFLNEHSSLISWLVVIFGITLVFITWLAFRHDRMIEDERSESL